MWSAALDAILTTLRYLAPATLLTLFWGQESFLFKLLKSIDSAFRAIVFSSEEQKQEVLQWLAEAGPVRVEHLDTVWRHGWIICGVLDSALPGACAGHPPNRLSLKHAQSIADHYLGVEPVFSRQELESNDSLSRHQEWKLATYLVRIREALSKLTPPVSKPTSQRTSPETVQFTLDYVARGSGLTAAQVKNKMFFKIYPTSQQSLDPGEITVLIRGPKDTYGMTVMPPILGKAQLIRQKLLGLQAKANFTENILPITHGATYMRTFGKNDMKKTYHIPKTTYDIDIEVESHTEHAKVGYTVSLEGKYEISITSRGQNIVGSPFSMTASNNIINILEKENYCLEDGEEIDILDVKSDRKVVLRIVDFVTEKMLLKENGTLEKISDDEARILMSTDTIPIQFTDFESRVSSTQSYRNDDYKGKRDKFNKAAYKVVQMNRVCRIINSLLAEKKRKEKAFMRSRSQQDIPDIVNSTFSDTKNNPFMLHEKRDKLIIPENITVSIKTEKSKPLFEPLVVEKDKTSLNTLDELTPQDSLEKYESIHEQIEDLSERSNSSNPFLSDIYEQNFVIEKDLGSFVKTEYEANKDQNEEAESPPIKILIETDDNTPSISPMNTNPFVEPDIIMERPKTPVLKIITGQIKNREDSVFVDPKAELIPEEMLGNEFINPFFIHHHEGNQNERFPVTDFIIGAPVSLPPILRTSTPEPHMDSIIITEGKIDKVRDNNKNNDESSSVFSTPLHTSIKKFKESQKSENMNSCTSSTFYSLDSNETDAIEILSLSNGSDNQDTISRSERDVTPKKDIWDSAYVSIDDSNSSPDSNNNDNNQIFEPSSKQKVSLTNTDYEYMGPAEREIWQTCDELSSAVIEEEIKPKWEVKRPIFTPILEESDRSISTGIKEKSPIEACVTEHQTVTVAFAERNDLLPVIQNLQNIIQLDTDHSKYHKDASVDSASVISDVKRHAKQIEGKISEVQANVTESVSVSQTLHGNDTNIKSNDELKSQEQCNNIVLEKKQYWDERIREIQEKSTEEDKTQLRRRRLSARNLRQNDSLTKRRGKQIVKNFIKAGEQRNSQQTDVKDIEVVNRKSPILNDTADMQGDIKLVEKWKKYWDSKLESEQDFESTCCRAKSPKSKESSASPQQRTQSTDDIIEAYNEPLGSKDKSLPVKQELPEEVFKAFETSPKRFFGTSRKQILNKIDTFLGKPSTADESSPKVSGAMPEYDTGLVSSRISLFHNISQTEELPWTRRKYHSMQNIFQRKDSEKSVESENLEHKTNVVTLSQDHIAKKRFLEKKSLTADTQELKEELNKVSLADSLKAKRARMVQNKHNKSFDESVTKKPLTFVPMEEVSAVKKTIKEYNKYSVSVLNYSSPKPLRKSSVSKSEMDIFTKITNKPVEDDLDKYKSFDELPKINVKNFISLYENVSKTDVSKPIQKLSRFNSTDTQRLSTSSSSTGAVNNVIGPLSSKKLEKYTSETDDSNTDLTQSPKNNWNKEPESMSSGSYEPRSLDSIDVDIIPLKEPEKETTYIHLSDIDVEIVENSENAGKSEKTCEEQLEAETIKKEYKSRFKMAKEYFQSLEELRELKKPKKLNECEMLLLNESTESLENDRPQKRLKKGIKSHSMPSSEISKIWNQLQDNQNDNSKLVKISEKFNVDDLFNDVTEGKLSRQGSLRGIPHKKAVLEAFRSMENLTDTKVSSYEIAFSQLSDFAKENSIKNVQTYLTEYPYLPTTDPSKYHSRLDTKASGLVSLKELHTGNKPRRNSVPDLRLNTSFTVQL